MQIEINGESVQLSSQTLSNILIEEGYVGESFAVAINGEFVSRGSYDTHKVNNGDRLDIVSPIAGG